MKKIILFTLTIYLISCASKRQAVSNQKKEGSTTNPQTLPKETDSVIDELPVIMEINYKMPNFPGGDEAFYSYISKNIKYPKKAKDNNIAGKVYSQFTVNEDGSITDVKILRGIGSGCDEEAKRVIESMPNWEPKMVKGKPVKETMVVPVKFILSK